jgi:hypothetical protein
MELVNFSPNFIYIPSLGVEDETCKNVLAMIRRGKF